MYGFDISSFAGELLYSVASILRGGRTVVIARYDIRRDF
jgi:hypothetical protein